MTAQLRRVFDGVIVFSGICVVAVMVSHAQSPSGTNAARYAAETQLDKSEEAEREEIWNSPEMLRARAWLKDYCSKSVKVTPEMAKEYQEELENMSAAQLKLWLLKFEHEEEQRQQTYAAWHQQNSIAVARGFAADRAADQSMAEFNQEQNKAAGEAQRQIDEQTEAEQTRQLYNQMEPIGPYGPYGYGYGGLGYGGVHYHYHIYQ